MRRNIERGESAKLELDETRVHEAGVEQEEAQPHHSLDSYHGGSYDIFVLS